MAMIQIHEDIENDFRPRGKEVIRKTTKLQKLHERVPLGHISNGVRGKKRARICSDDENIDGEKDSSLTLDCLKLIVTDSKKHEESEEEVEDKCSPDEAEYAPDIWRYLFKMESQLKWPKPDYLRKQKHINEDMRCILVDWLVTVAEEYKMSEQTIHLSVNYIDRFLSYMSVIREKFQLLGATAMFVAVKVEEVNLLDASEWVYLTGKAYTTRQIILMEQLLLKVLKFDVNPPTMMVFIQHLCSAHGLDRKTLYTAMYICELILLEGGPYLHHVPSKLAVAAVVLARYILKKKNPWFKKLEISSGYTYEQLSPIVTKQYHTYRESPTKEQQAIQNKYKREKYHKVAVTTAKVLCLDDPDS